VPEILSRAGPLLASHARSDEPFHPGQIYVAPPDYHLLLAPGGRVALSRGPRENRHRPAVDVLFRTAARYYGPRVVAVVLSGSMSDGTAGLLAVRAAGGIAVVQDPRDAAMAAMPENAFQIAGADFLVPAGDLARVLVDQVHKPLSGDGSTTMEDPLDKMMGAVDTTMSQQARNERGGSVSVFTCPECGGPLWQVDERPLIRFRCHVGHVYGAETLLSEQSEALEAALWTAVRTFRENSILSRQMATAARARNDTAAAARYQEQAEQALNYSELIEQLLLKGTIPQIPAAGREAVLSNDGVQTSPEPAAHPGPIAIGKDSDAPD
jgi:two-component system chemotaxis response regulator CheB